MMDWAAFTTFCSSLRSWAEQEPYQAVIQPERMLSMVHLENIAAFGTIAAFGSIAAFGTTAAFGTISAFGTIIGR